MQTQELMEDESEICETCGNIYQIVWLREGDDYNDFAYLGERPPEERLEAARQYSDYWGTKWIMLPNPMYGGWEQALYGYRRDLPDDAKLEAKHSHLKTRP